MTADVPSGQRPYGRKRNVDDGDQQKAFDAGVVEFNADRKQSAPEIDDDVIGACQSSAVALVAVAALIWLPFLLQMLVRLLSALVMNAAVA